MSFRLITILSFAACVGFGTRSAFAELLAGFHQFDDVTEVGVGFTKNGADEGIFAAAASITYNTGSASTGGSTDNWYGPDGTNVYDGTSTGLVGGHITNQTPIGANTPGTINPPYVFETTGADPRLSPAYAVNAPIPPNTIGGNTSTADGRIRSFNGTDVEIVNNTDRVYQLDSFVFDALVGDASLPGTVVNIEDFVLTYSGADGSSSAQLVTVSAGYAGYHSQSGDGLNGPLSDPLLVNNQVDYGIGSNYFDYVVNLNGFIMNPGDVVSIGLNSTAVGGTARGDNFAYFGTAVPESSSVLAIGASLGLGALSRRRKRRSQAVSVASEK